MLPHTLFDPPEYAKGPSNEATSAFADACVSGPWSASIAQISPSLHVRIYDGLIRSRLHDQMLARWARQGTLSKAWLATGEEAVTIGPVAAMAQGKDVLGPMIRNAGACVMWDLGLEAIFQAYLGRAGAPTGGRDLHFGDLDKGLMTPISHVGSLVPVMAGMALSFKARREPKAALTWVGDGAAHTGEFHEAMAFAASQGVPLIVILQDNGVALGTPRAAHHRGSFAALGALYGIPTAHFDGNHVLEAFGATRWARERCLKGEGPVLLTTRTFRMGGHATHDEAEGRRLLPPEEFTYWGARDPIALYAQWLSRGDVTLPGAKSFREKQALLEQLEDAAQRDINAAADAALKSPLPRGEDALGGVYAGSAP